ncbi:MAG TPA: hypothetical protein VFI31_20980 [Pirellulales bacterium]|nr:hypothetical protein [Pirellulales bacterium]
MTVKQVRSHIAAGLTMAALVTAGCGEHIEKKHEELVSPSQKGTQAEKEPVGPVHHGEAPSNAEP